jgi:hypothetical protein
VARRPKPAFLIGLQPVATLIIVGLNDLPVCKTARIGVRMNQEEWRKRHATHLVSERRANRAGSTKREEDPCVKKFSSSRRSPS